METNTAALRALYTDCRNAKRNGLPVDRATVVSVVAHADAKIIVAFDALLGGSIVADHARMIEDARRMDDALRAQWNTARAAEKRAAEANARREARRLARETAATITEW